MMKWKCTVCGYIHTGDEPPENCPVCGADKSKFVEISLDEAAKLEPTAPKPKDNQAQASARKNVGFQGFLYEQLHKHHIHPISTHFPNGVLPFTVTFLVLSMIFCVGGMELAAFLNLIGVTLTMPLVLFSGYVDWKTVYHGAKTRVFITKIACGIVVTSLGMALVVWRILMPDVAAAGSGWAYAYLVLHLAMLGAAGLAGFLGGEIVFGTYGKSEK